jgi:hypothetical protein
MAGKRFDPFEDEKDELEFVPQPASTPRMPAARTESQTDPGPNKSGNAGRPNTQITNVRGRIREMSNAETQIKENAKGKSRLRLSFDELEDAETDHRNAVRIGSESLGADEFMVGIKRRDFDEAMERAELARRAILGRPVEVSRVRRSNRRPLYLTLLGFVLLIGGLVGGSYVYKNYTENKEAERLRALQDAANHAETTEISLPDLPEPKQTPGQTSPKKSPGKPKSH